VVVVGDETDGVGATGAQTAGETVRVVIQFGDGGEDAFPYLG
jgi:hypothetical protein